MTLATTPTLGGVSLPVPKEQKRRRFYRGGTLEMADGSIVHDLVDATARHGFTLRWEFRTDAELATITAQWDAIKNTTATYVSVTNTSHTVTQPEVGAELDVTVVTVNAGHMRYHITMELLEDS